MIFPDREPLKPTPPENLNPLQVKSFRWIETSNTPSIIREPRWKREQRSDEQMVSVEGIVSNWNAEKGFGFVKIPGYTKDFFLHRNAIDREPERGEEIHISTISLTNPKGQSIEKALSKKAKTGELFLAEVENIHPEEVFIPVNTNDVRIKLEKGTILYHDESGTTYSMPFAKEDIGFFSGTIPSTVYIPDPQKYPHLYTFSQNDNQQQAVMEIQGSGLVLTQDLYRSLVERKKQQQDEQILEEVFTRDDSLRLIESTFTEYVLSGVPLKRHTERNYFPSESNANVKGQIYFQVEPTEIVFDESTNRMSLSADVTFTLSRENATVSRTANIALENFTQFYLADRRVESRNIQSKDDVEQIHSKFTSGGNEFLVEYNVLGKILTVAHPVTSPEFEFGKFEKVESYSEYVVDEDQNLSKSTDNCIFYTFSVPTPTEILSYRILAYRYDRSTFTPVEIDESVLPTAMQSEFHRLTTEFDENYQEAAVKKAREVAKEVKQLLIPTEQNTQVRKIHFPFIPTDFDLEAEQLAWMKKACTGIEIQLPFIDRKTQQPVLHSLHDIPPHLIDFYSKKNKYRIGFELTGPSSRIYGLHALLKSLDEHHLHEVLSEFPDLQVVSSDEKFREYENSVANAIIEAIAAAFPDGLETYVYKELLHGIPDGIEKKLLNVVSALKDGWLTPHYYGKGSEAYGFFPDEWCYAYQGKEYRLPQIMFSCLEIPGFKLTKSDSPILEEMYEFYVSDNVIGLHADQQGNTLRIPNLDLETLGRFKWGLTSNDTDLATFQVMLIDRNHQPLKDDSGEIVWAKAVLQRIYSSWEGDEMRSGSNHRSAVDLVLHIFSPTEVDLQVAVGKPKHKVVADNYHQRITDRLTSAPKNEKLAKFFSPEENEYEKDFITTLTPQDLSQVLVVTSMLLETIDKDHLKDWGIEVNSKSPTYWKLLATQDSLMKAVMNRSTFPHSSEKLLQETEKIFNFLELVKKLIRTKIESDRKRTLGYRLYERFDLPKDQESLVFEILSEDGSPLKYQTINHQTETQREYKEIPPSAVEVLVQVTIQTEEVINNLILELKPSIHGINEYQIKEIEKILLQSIGKTVFDVELGLLEFKTTAELLQKAVNKVLRQINGDSRVMMEISNESGKLFIKATINGEVHHVQVPSVELSTTHNTVADLVNLAKFIKSRTKETNSPINTSYVWKIEEELKKSNLSEQRLQSLQYLLLNVASDRGIVIDEKSYTEISINELKRSALPFSRAPIWETDDENDDEQYTLPVRRNPRPERRPANSHWTPPSGENIRLKYDDFLELLRKNTQELLQNIQDIKKSNIGVWRMSVAALLLQKEENRQLLANQNIAYQDFDEMIPTLQKVISEASARRHVKLDDITRQIHDTIKKVRVAQAYLAALSSPLVQEYLRDDLEFRKEYQQKVLEKVEKRIPDEKQKLTLSDVEKIVNEVLEEMTS